MILKRAAAEKILGRKIKAPASKKWFLLSADGTKNLGGYPNRAGAENREREVQYFKRNPVTKADLRKLMRGYSSAEYFASADLSGFGAMSDASIVEMIVRHTRGRPNMRALRDGVSSHGRWWFLTEVDPLDVDAGTHGVVVPSGDEDLERPIIVGVGGVVLDGRHRVMAARELGLKRLPAYAPASFVYRRAHQKRNPPKPKNTKLYEKVKAAAKKKFDVWPSIPASSWVVAEYKKRGGTYEGKKPGKRRGLEKWYDEEWVDLSRSIDAKGRVKKWVQCARPDQGERAYPKCVPLAKAKEMTPKQRLSAIRRKRKAERKTSKKKGRSPKMVSTLTANPRKALYIYPNKSSIAAAKRGLKAREKAPKSLRGGLDALQAKAEGVGSGVLRARDIIAGKRINAYQVKAFFDRHQGNYISAVAKGLPAHRSKAIQAWLIWGGDPLYRQVKRAVARDKKGLEPLKKDTTKPNPRRNASDRVGTPMVLSELRGLAKMSRRLKEHYADRRPPAWAEYKIQRAQQNLRGAASKVAHGTGIKRVANPEEGYMVRANLDQVAEDAEYMHGTISPDAKMPEWLEHLVHTAHADVERIYTRFVRRKPNPRGVVDEWDVIRWPFMGNEPVGTMSVEELEAIADPNAPLDRMAREEAAYIRGLRKDIKARGFVNPIIIKKGRGIAPYIFDGHHRLIAARQLGIERVPIAYYMANPKRKDRIKGGLADKRKPSDFDAKELRMGIKVEMEHTVDRRIAREIAMDHLAEHPDYYTALEKMEGKLKEGFWAKAHDWDQVLIDKGGKKLTRKKILDHYKKVEKKIWPFLKGQTVMVYIGTGRNQSILRRKGPDGKHIKLTKLKGVEDPHSLEYWTHRRVIEFHPVITGKTTPLVWVDLDPKLTKANEASLRRKMKAAVPRVKAVLRKVFGAKSLHVYTSGKRGIHIEGNLPRAMDANRLRRTLRAAMDDEFSDDKVFTTKVPKVGQIRLDTNLLKQLGSIRAPYSMSVMGRAKLPVKATASKKKAKPKRRRNPEESSLFHVTYSGRLPGIVEDGLGPGRDPSIGGEAYNWNRRDSIFLSESDGVGYWYDLASRWAFDSSDAPAEDGLVPVVLRVSGGPLTTDSGFDKFCEDDEVGWSDSNRPTYKCKTTINPKYLQVWTGSSWVPVRRYGDIDMSSAGDMHAWEDALMPVGAEMELGKKRANPRRRRNTSIRRRRRNPEVQELSRSQYDRLKALATDRKAHLWDEDPDLEHIGLGGERIVYGLVVGDREPFAFKIDQGTKLHRQTEFEVKCLVKSNNPLAPDIFDWDRKNYRWIEMELMTSLPDTDDPEAVFEKASGIDWDSWSFAFETYGGYLTDWAGVLKNLPKTPKAKRFIAMVRAFVEDCELATSELGLPDNWGVTRDGKLKPLDLGY